MKILFLDDNDLRHVLVDRNIINQDIVHVETAREAIEQLSNNDFDLIMLDHDLDENTNNVLVEEEEDGRFVCRWMAENFESKETTVIIHSLNEPGSKEVRQILFDGGFKTCYRIPFAWNKAYINEDGNLNFNM